MIKNHILNIILCLICTNYIYSQVQVSAPDTTKKHDKNIIIPINVSSLTGLGIRSYQFRLKYDQSILKAKSIIDNNTISDKRTWDIDAYLDNEGLVVKADGRYSLTGEGTLIKIKFKVIAEEGFTDLVFDPFIFNNGNPQAATENGSFRVYVEKRISFSKVGDGKGEMSIDGKNYELPFSIDLVQGENYKLRALPNESSIFNNWSGEFNSSSNPIDFQVKDKTEIRLEFLLKSFSVSAIINPEGSGSVDGIGIYQYGSEADLSASAFNNNEFISWSIDGNVVSEDPNYLIDVYEDFVITANFEAAFFQISAVSNPLNAGQITGAGYYYPEQNATIIASSNTDYTFENWMENGEVISEDSVLNIIADDNRSLTANYSIITDIKNDDENLINKKIFISDPYPNPFNPATNFEFGLDSPSVIKLIIIDISGKIVSIIFNDKYFGAGTYRETFNAANLSSGIYFYNFKVTNPSNSKSYAKSGKIIFVK